MDVAAAEALVVVDVQAALVTGAQAVPDAQQIVACAPLTSPSRRLAGDRNAGR